MCLKTDFKRTINLPSPVKLEAFIWDTKVPSFLAEILQEDFQLALESFEVKSPSYDVAFYAQPFDYLTMLVVCG